MTPLSRRGRSHWGDGVGCRRRLQGLRQEMEEVLRGSVRGTAAEGAEPGGSDGEGPQGRGAVAGAEARTQMGGSSCLLTRSRQGKAQGRAKAAARVLVLVLVAARGGARRRSASRGGAQKRAAGGGGAAACALTRPQEEAGGPQHRAALRGVPSQAPGSTEQAAVRRGRRARRTESKGLVHLESPPPRTLTACPRSPP